MIQVMWNYKIQAESCQPSLILSHWAVLNIQMSDSCTVKLIRFDNLKMWAIVWRYYGCCRMLIRIEIIIITMKKYWPVIFWIMTESGFVTGHISDTLLKLELI